MTTELHSKLRTGLLSLSLFACGGKSIAVIGYGPDGGGTGGSGEGGAGTSAAGKPGLVTNSSGVDGLGCPGIEVGDDELRAVETGACRSLSVECLAGLPVDLHLLVERSSRMLATVDGVSKWELARRGIAGFLGGLASHHRVGLRVFGATGDDASDCEPRTYAPSLVPPGNGATTFAAIDDAFETLSVEGAAPTVAALAGTLDEIERVQTQTRDAQRVVLVLGGPPSACGDNADALRAAFASSPVTSYLVAIAPGFDVGPVAESAETWPFVIEHGHGSTRLTAALAHIAAGATRRVCDFGRDPPSDVAVVHDLTRAFFRGEEIPQLRGPAECETSAYGGFYFSESAGRVEYQACSCSCARFTTCDSGEWHFFCR